MVISMESEVKCRVQLPFNSVSLTLLEKDMNPSSFRSNSRADWALLPWGGNQSRREKSEFKNQPEVRCEPSGYLALKITVAVVDVGCSCDPNGLQESQQNMN